MLGEDRGREDAPAPQREIKSTVSSARIQNFDEEKWRQQQTKKFSI